MPSVTQSNVWAAVVTHNRKDALLETLRGIFAQDPKPSGVVVVDNASSDGTDDAIDRAFGADVLLVRNSDNGGYASGVNLAIDAVGERADVLWVLNDDSPPGLGALATLLAALDEFPTAGIVGSTGYRIRLGTPRPAVLDRTNVCDCVLIDSTLLVLSAAADIGPLRNDFFMMWEEFEYSSRLRAGGYDVVALAHETSDRRHLGSVDANAWRAYYHSRNQVRDALDRGGKVDVVVAVYRHLKLTLAALVYPHQQRRLTKAALRVLGLRDAFRNRMGRVGLPAWAGPHP